MDFVIDKNTKIIEGQVIYNIKEYSFDFEPIRNSDIFIMIGYLYLGFDSNSKYLQQIWGYHPDSNWIVKNLNPPKAFQGGLLLENGIKPGISKRIMDIGDLRTYFDKNNGWICIGDECSSVDDNAVEFATGSLVVLNNKNIKSIWLQPIFR